MTVSKNNKIEVGHIGLRINFGLCLCNEYLALHVVILFDIYDYCKSRLLLCITSVCSHIEETADLFARKLGVKYQ